MAEEKNISIIYGLKTPKTLKKCWGTTTSDFYWLILFKNWIHFPKPNTDLVSDILYSYLLRSKHISFANGIKKGISNLSSSTSDTNTQSFFLLKNISNCANFSGSWLHSPKNCQSHKIILWTSHKFWLLHSPVILRRQTEIKCCDFTLSMVQFWYSFPCLNRKSSFKYDINLFNTKHA